MKRIQSQAPGRIKLPVQVLSWTTCAKRPITTLGRRRPLAIEPGASKLDGGTLTLSEAQDIVLYLFAWVYQPWRKRAAIFV